MDKGGKIVLRKKNEEKKQTITPKTTRGDNAVKSSLAFSRLLRQNPDDNINEEINKVKKANTINKYIIY